MKPLAADARILIVSRDEFLTGPLADGLAKLGWPALAARGAAAAAAAVSDRQLEGALVDLSADEDFSTLGKRLKEASAPRHLPTIAIGELKKPHSGFFGSMLPSPHIEGYKTAEMMFEWVTTGKEPPKYTAMDEVTLITRENFKQELEKIGLWN